MRALVEEVVGAVAMTQVVEAPRLALSGGAAGDRILIDEHLDGAHVAGEVAGVGIRLRQTGGGDPGVVLRGLGRTVSQPGLELEERERLLGVEELGGNGRASPMAGNGASRIAFGDA